MSHEFVWSSRKHFIDKTNKNERQSCARICAFVISGTILLDFSGRRRNETCLLVENRSAQHRTKTHKCLFFLAQSVPRTINRCCCCCIVLHSNRAQCEHVQQNSWNHPTGRTNATKKRFYFAGERASICPSRHTGKLTEKKNYRNLAKCAIAFVATAHCTDETRWTKTS